MGKGQTSPTTLDTFEQTNANHILCPGILGLVGFGSMIKDVSTAEDLFKVMDGEDCNQGMYWECRDTLLRTLTFESDV